MRSLRPLFGYYVGLGLFLWYEMSHLSRRSYVALRLVFNKACESRRRLHRLRVARVFLRRRSN